MLEVHLTVMGPIEEAWLEAHALKLTHLELRGEVIQSLATARWELPIEDAIRRAHALADELRSLPSVSVRRIKIEGALSKDDQTAGLYIEHHLKVRFRSEQLCRIDELAERMGAHLSKSQGRRLPDGVEERFLTQRFAPDDRKGADSALAALKDAIEDQAWIIVKIDRERALYDDHIALDAAWLSTGGVR